jgi:malonyl-CoA/methylmalonyl-CoA synthetase
MRLFISGSAPLLIETFGEWRQRTGHTILERYGMSETIMLTSNPYGPMRATAARTSAAAAPWAFRCRAWACAWRATRPAAAHGRDRRHRGPGTQCLQRLLAHAGKTAQEFTADGWFKTGDVGKLDERGYVTIVGRSKDLIISGGYNVYPAEIEGFINEMPGVAESALVGVPHPDFGEVGVAVVVARPGIRPAAMRSSRAEAQLANFKIPKRCFVVPELPRNTMGKVQKNLLRDQYQSVHLKSIAAIACLSISSDIFNVEILVKNALSSSLL